MKHSGKFITFEGLDGCGKSTQLEREASRLRQQGLPVVTTQEPGGTATGRKIREIVLHATSHPLSASTELALMFAARSQHIEEVILPALHAGKVVLCDRFTDSSVAYQGYGRGIAPDAIRALEDLFCRGLRPDLTIILDIDPATGMNRVRARNRAAQEKETRFEEEGLEFFRRVRKGYEEIARQEPGRVRLIDGKGSVDDVHHEVHEQVRKAADAFRKAGSSGGASGV
ncbi:MAG: dTMP kinase [Acidobacteria bacterium]|nr:dTMP kinase [Acidobacteriota bacterium]